MVSLCALIQLQRHLEGALVLVNDDKTRSFLALRVSAGAQQFNQVLRCVDQCLACFKQPTYYQVRNCFCYLRMQREN